MAVNTEDMKYKVVIYTRKRLFGQREKVSLENVGERG